MEAAYTRRRLVAGLGLLAVVPGLRVRSADAAVRWCRKDPVVKIDGQVADIWLASEETLDRAATGTSVIVVTVPVGVTTELLAVDRGFGGFGYDVRFEQSPALGKTAGVQVQIAVYVPASKRGLPVVVDFAPRSAHSLTAAHAEGTVNRWVKLGSG